MARVEILESLKDDVLKKFKEDSKRIFGLMMSVEDYPKKGKYIGKVGNVAIKELKHKSFRFYS